MSYDRKYQFVSFVEKNTSVICTTVDGKNIVNKLASGDSKKPRVEYVGYYVDFEQATYVGALSHVFVFEKLGFVLKRMTFASGLMEYMFGRTFEKYCLKPPMLQHSHFRGLHVGGTSEIDMALISTECCVSSRIWSQYESRSVGLLKQCRKILIDVCRRLEALHVHDFIHGDVKPHNIVFAPRSQMRNALVVYIDMDMDIQGKSDLRYDGEYRLIDFNSTSLIGDLAGEEIATMGFRSPEEFDKQEITPKSDIFGLAMTVLNVLGCYHQLDRSQRHMMKLHSYFGKSIRSICEGQVWKEEKDKAEDMGIGDLNVLSHDKRLAKLLHHMISLDPSARPSARDILGVLEQDDVSSVPCRPEDEFRNPKALRLDSRSFWFLFKKFVANPCSLNYTAFRYMIAILLQLKFSCDTHNYLDLLEACTDLSFILARHFYRLTPDSSDFLSRQTNLLRICQELDFRVPIKFVTMLSGEQVNAKAREWIHKYEKSGLQFALGNLLLAACSVTVDKIKACFHAYNHRRNVDHWLEFMISNAPAMNMTKNLPGFIRVAKGIGAKIGVDK